MNTMTWLFLGHLVGDWLLQNDWMAKGKKKGFFSLPGLTHFAVYTIVLLGVLIFDGRGEYNGLLLFLVGLLIFLSHWILDATNIVERWMRFYHQTEAPMIRLMVDQTFHFVILALIAVWVNTW
jgi:hypothetical protein